MVEPSGQLAAAVRLRESGEPERARELGSTLRALGRYPEAVRTLARGVAAFPDDTALPVFLAMARYNAGDGKNAVAELLRLLLRTTEDQEIRRYQRAIALYVEDLDRVWT